MTVAGIFLLYFLFGFFFIFKEPNFCLFFVHNILPQAKEGDLSPHFNEEMYIGILFIDRPISIDMFVLVKKLSTGLIWDPIC